MNNWSRFEFPVFREELGLPKKSKYSRPQHIRSLMEIYYPETLESIDKIDIEKNKNKIMKESKVYANKCKSLRDALLISPHIIAELL